MSELYNPSAFPLAIPGDCQQQPEWGMELRDYFAGQALVGIMSTAGAFERADRRHDMVAAQAYRFADALLAHRAKATGENA